MEKSKGKAGQKSEKKKESDKRQNSVWVIFKNIGKEIEKNLQTKFSFVFAFALISAGLGAIVNIYNLWFAAISLGTVFFLFHITKYIYLSEEKRKLKFIVFLIIIFPSVFIIFQNILYINVRFLNQKPNPIKPDTAFSQMSMSVTKLDSVNKFFDKMEKIKEEISLIQITSDNALYPYCLQMQLSPLIKDDLSEYWLLFDGDIGKAISIPKIDFSVLSGTIIFPNFSKSIFPPNGIIIKVYSKNKIKLIH